VNKVKGCWREGRAALSAWLQLPGALHAEAVSRLGYDAVVIDLQHSSINIGAAAAMLVAIELGGAEPFVRLQVNDPADAMKLLDLGAYGVIAPMVQNAEDARRFSSALHYAPRGERSFGPRRPALRYGLRYVESASDTVVGLVMIETRRALGNLDEILAVQGIDGVFVGPTDLALDMGYPPVVDSEQPEVMEAIATIGAKARRAGKHAGIFCSGGSSARRRLEQGFDFVTTGPDLGLLTAAAQAALIEARQAGRPHE